MQSGQKSWVTTINYYARQLWRWGAEEPPASQPPPVLPHELQQVPGLGSEINIIVELIKKLKTIDQKLEAIDAGEATQEEREKREQYIQSRSEVIQQLKAAGKKIGCPFLEGLTLENRKQLLADDPAIARLLQKHLDRAKKAEKPAGGAIAREEKTLLPAAPVTRDVSPAASASVVQPGSPAGSAEKRIHKLPDLKPHQIIERATYFVVYRLEYNVIYQFCALSSLKDHCSNLTQLQPIYDLVLTKLGPSIGEGQIPLPLPLARFRFLKEIEMIPKGMRADLLYLKNHPKLNAKDRRQIKGVGIFKETQEYLAELQQIDDPLILFGHLMVLLHVNTHGGTFGLRTGLIDVYEKAGLVKEVDFYTNLEPYRFSSGLEEARKKVEKLQAGMRGGLSFIEYRPNVQKTMRNWIDLVCKRPDGSIDEDKVDKVLRGYIDCFSHLGSIYEKIMKNSALVEPTASTKRTKTLLKKNKLSYSPEERLSNIQSGRESDLLMQLEHVLRRPPYAKQLREIGFKIVVGLDDEPGATHSPISPDSRTVKKEGPEFRDQALIKSRGEGPDKIYYYRLSALPAQTLRLTIAESKEEDQRILIASWVDERHGRQDIQMPLPDPEDDLQLFDDNYLKALSRQLVKHLQQAYSSQDIRQDLPVELPSEIEPEEEAEDKHALEFEQEWAEAEQEPPSSIEDKHDESELEQQAQPDQPDPKPLKASRRHFGKQQLFIDKERAAVDLLPTPAPTPVAPSSKASIPDSETASPPSSGKAAQKLSQSSQVLFSASPREESSSRPHSKKRPSKMFSPPAEPSAKAASSPKASAAHPRKTDQAGKK